MGSCEYRYNVSENYQRTKSGMAPETHCGGRTYPAQDEPELRYIQDLVDNGEGGFVPVDRMVPTGRLVNRDRDDPYCPLHGGCPEPPAVQVTLTEIEQAGRHYQALVAQYQGVAPAIAPPPVPPVPAVQSVPVRAAEFDQAAAIAGGAFHTGSE
jgi:hypothetical protein